MDYSEMKLRIRGNTLRLRVSKNELAQMIAQGWVEDAIQFAADSSLIYRLETGTFAAEHSGGRICVRVPKSAVTLWARDDEVSIRHSQSLEGGGVLEILVEKDFECLNPRAGDAAADLFRNPAKEDA
jgi:hypothetical protein